MEIYILFSVLGHMSHLPYVWNISDITVSNNSYSKVLYTWEQLQIVAMCLKPWEDTGHDQHEKQDVLIRIEKWEATVDIDGFDYVLTSNMAVVVPVWSKHNTKNTSKTETLFIHMVYAVPFHADHKVHATKEESDKAKKALIPVKKVQPVAKKLIAATKVPAAKK
jgi:mannose-6-phosphate isomerase-like protein (cupin superfamily)